MLLPLPHHGALQPATGGWAALVCQPRSSLWAQQRAPACRGLFISGHTHVPVLCQEGEMI